MTTLARAPRILLLVSATIVAEALGLLVRTSISPLGATALVIVVLLAWFLLHGSRAAWVIIFLGAVTQLVGPLLFDQPEWVVATSLVVLVCLLAPTARSYVWDRRERPSDGRMGSAAQRRRDWLLTVPYALDDLPALSRRLVNRRVILRLAICVLLLALVDGAVSAWYHGSGGDSVVAAVSWRVAWIAFSLTQLALIALLAVAAYGYLRARWRGSRTGSI